MGNIRSCMTAAQATFIRNGNPDAWQADLICDIWPAAHVLNPFILYCLTGWWPFVAFLVGLNEVFEALARTLAGGSGVPLLEGADGGESITAALVDDWLICGGIGLLLGGLFMYHLEVKPLLTAEAWRHRRKEFWFYLCYTVAWISVYIVYALLQIETPPGTTGTQSSLADKSDLYLGPPTAVLFHGVLAILAYSLEPRFSSAWRSEPDWKRSTFWIGSWAISAVLEIQAPWDWLYSGAIQVYVVSAAIAVYLLIAAWYRGKWVYFITRFNSWSRQGIVDTFKEYTLLRD